MTEKPVSALDPGEPEDLKDYDNPIADVTVDSLDYLIGKLFTHTELLGLPDRQLNAYRSTVRKMFWEWYNNHLPNPSGLSDISYQARVSHGIEPHTTTSTGNAVYYNVIA